LKLDMLDFKGILMTDKILISLAYPCFSCYYVNRNDCTMYTSRCICRFWSTL